LDKLARWQVVLQLIFAVDRTLIERIPRRWQIGNGGGFAALAKCKKRPRRRAFQIGK
jgi:hypothetical protein